ncbi:MAG: AAA family ATPase [Chloroflexi bacterium]|jgi:dephospho-CoA kinase|nr:AAA family ATPase [Chloroflexota bacterium]MBT7081186.1 AAA family ATPase [Chloroflexota bacterium]MBT7290852.1 AAA family ATPase [Chloroflexota bacterium]
MEVIALVGMAGSGKSEVSRVFEDAGFKRVRFGDVTDEEIKRRGLELNETNERQVREHLRQDYGKAVYAILSIPKIDKYLVSSDVIIDGLYSWEEYNVLREKYADNLILVLVHSSPKTRYARLAQRPIRPLTKQEGQSRDAAEIENINKGGPIAMADHVIINESSMEQMTQDTERIITKLK